MIISQLRGRLGNQLFQYAIARALAKRQGVDFAMDTSINPNFPYAMHPYNIIENLVCLTEVHGEYVWEPDHGYSYNPSLVEGKKNLTLGGSWQSWKYFEDIKDIIKSEFTLREPVGTETKAMEDRILISADSVCLSIRRGDYLEPQWVKVLGVPLDRYYQEAIAHVTSKVKSPHFFIFSDEPRWAKENFHHTQGVPTTFVDINEDGAGYRTGREHEDLFLMSQCTHHIIPNSSFSWWGSYLRRGQGIAITPSRWFGDAKLQATLQADPSSLFPPDWIQWPIYTPTEPRSLRRPPRWRPS